VRSLVDAVGVALTFVCFGAIVGAILGGVR